MQAVAAKGSGHAPFLLDIRLQTPSTVIKVEFPWLVLSCLCWGNTRHCWCSAVSRRKLGQAGMSWAVDAALGSLGISQEG